MKTGAEMISRRAGPSDGLSEGPHSAPPKMKPKASKRAPAEPGSASREPSTVSSKSGRRSLDSALEGKTPSASRRKRKKLRGGDEPPVETISRGVALDFGDGDVEPPAVVGDETGGGAVSGVVTEVASPDGDGGDGVKPESLPSNLELVRLLRNSKELKSRKIEVAYQFVKHQEERRDRNGDNNARTQVQEAEAESLSLPQLVSFLSEWVQSAVLHSCKPQQMAKIPQNPEGKETHSTYPAHLDARYWAILRWCLSTGYLISYSYVSPNVMKSLNVYVSKMLEDFGPSEHDGGSQGRLEGTALLTEDSLCSLEALLVINERAFRPDLDQWVSLASTALSKFVAFSKVVNEKLDATSRLQRLTMWILEGFARFIAVHPNRRKVFTAVIEKLLESLLTAAAGLRTQSSQRTSRASDSESQHWSQRILRAIEDILEKGLFDGAHVGSFQQVCTIFTESKEFDSKACQVNGKRRKLNSKGVGKRHVEEKDKDMHWSYHRLFFQQLESFRQKAPSTPLTELGWIFRVYSKSFRAYQTASGIDVFGAISKGKRSVESSKDDTPNSTANGKQPKQRAHLDDDKSQKSEPLFAVFAELMGPLMLFLETFTYSVNARDFNTSIEHVSSTRAILNATAGLLKAAIEENTYVPTDVNAGQSHFSFLQMCFSTLINVGKALPRAMTAGRATGGYDCNAALSGKSSWQVDGDNLKAVLGGMLYEVITAITCIVVLEYRVVENSLQDVWVILLAGAILQQSVGVTTSITNYGAVDAACIMISIFSDLRQADRPFLSLCTILRQFMSQGSKVSHRTEEMIGCKKGANQGHEEVEWFAFLEVKSIELLVCAEPLLMAVSSAVRSLPEGQVAEFLKLVRSDARESMALLDRYGDFKHCVGSLPGYSGDQCVAVGLKGLVELYSHMLESVNITSTNSVLCGKEICQFLTEIVIPKLNALVEFFVTGTVEDNVAIVGQMGKVKEYDHRQTASDALENGHLIGSEKATDDTNDLNTWVTVFLLRLFMITQSLHRESVSLMPPKAAKKASEVLNGPVNDYQKRDASHVLSEVGTRFFLSGLSSGTLKSSSLLAGIERRQGGQGLVACPALDYALDCIALRSLVDLAGQIDSLNFLVLRFEDVTDVASDENSQQTNPAIEGLDAIQLGSSANLGFDKGRKTVQKKVQKLLRTMTLESQKLTKFLLKGIPLEERMQDTKCTARNLDLIDQTMNTHDPRSMVANAQLLSTNFQWVESLLTVDTLLIQRWKLLCSSFDVWAKLAAEDDLRNFLVCLFSTLVVCSRSHYAGEDQKAGPCPVTQKRLQMRKITDVLLSDALFYEEESFRRVFASTFLGQLKRSLLSAFGRWSFESYTSDMLMTEEVQSFVAEEWAKFVSDAESDVGIGLDIGITNLSSVKVVPPEKLAAKEQELNSTKNRSPSKRRKNEGLKWSKVHLPALDSCVGLLDHLSALPPGYIKLHECTPCVYTILCFERSLMSCLLDLRAAARYGLELAGLRELSIICKIFEAFCTCRAALAALSSSENFRAGNSPLLSVLAGSSAALHWLAFSIHAAAVCLVDTLEWSNLPLQQRKDLKSAADAFVNKALKSTAFLLAYVSDQSLSSEPRRSYHPDAEVKTNVSEAKESRGVQRAPDRVVLNQCPNLLSGLLDCYAKLAELVVGSSFANELKVAHHKENGASVGQSMKARYTGLAISTSLSTYTRSLSKFLEDSLKSSVFENGMSILPAGTAENVRKLGQNIMRALVNALLPAGSHAILLVGECEIQSGMSSGENGISIRILDRGHQGSKQSKGMLNMGSDDEEEDEENDLAVVDGLEADEEDQKGVGEEEEPEGDSESEALELQEMDDLGTEYDLAMEVSELSMAQSSLQQSLLENMLEDTTSKFDVIGELYLAMAEILKVEKMTLMHNRSDGHTWSFLVEGSQFQNGLPADVNILMGAGYWLLLKACERVRSDQWCHLGWLLGVVKYLEAVYRLLPNVKPPLPPSVFTKLFDLHIFLLGSLSSTKEYVCSSLFPLDDDRLGMPIIRGPADETTVDDEDQTTFHLLRAAVQESVGTLLRTNSRQYSVLALQSIMKALIGTAGDVSRKSGLEITGVKSGKVDKHVAAGVDCLRISLEAFSGMKRLRLLANHFNEFFGAIFNLVEFLQGPHLFQQGEFIASLHPRMERKETWNQRDQMVNSGPVILQALQILITATSRDTVFPMKACHVALALHCPARVFSSLRHCWSSGYTTHQNYSAAEQMGQPRNPCCTSALKMCSAQGVRLYVLCCRLLCSLVRHRRRGSGHCMALLGESARVLLHCLEAPNWPLSEVGGARDWTLRMAEYCAGWLRRIYEEMGEHRETLGKYCSHMLSDYLTVLSGHGPHGAGLMREVEAALQPGAFVLVDACSANDLQQLHASLGEGSLRTAFVDLRRQYQQRFKYTGKV